MRFRRILLLIAFLAPLFSALAGPARSQSDHWPNRGDGLGNAGQYNIRTGPEDKLTIDVQIWGQVNRPGQYFVPDRTDLIGLISYAGGPTEDAKLAKVQVLRPQAENDRVRRVDLVKFLQTGDPAMIPRLTPGDVVVVPASRSRGITRMAGIVSVLALVANVTLLAARQ